MIRQGELRVEPVIPSGWKGFQMYYRHAGSVYEIRVENPEGVSRGVAWVEIDGRRLEDRAIPLDTAPVKHRVRVRMGTGKDATAPAAPSAT
ncbi:MAG TPA: hypothetical protein VJK02_23330, partial [Anaerolineales bacterium]|nr:hypothetical protein [Anaerolineales bacterium]